MPSYRNTKTGAEFFSPCECKGADIEQLPETQSAEPVKEEPAPKKTTRRSTKK